MAKNPELESLRRDALRKVNNAARKMGRIQREQHIKVSGSQFDPTIPRDRIKKLNSRQLKALNKRLDQFTSRETQFVAGHHNAPISRQSWFTYEKLQGQMNARITAEREALSGVMLPGASVTIGERVRRNLNVTFGEGGEHSLDQYRRKHTGITSEKSMRTLIKDMRRRLGRGYESQLDAKRRKNFADMLNKHFDRDDIIEELNKLSPREFKILWENDRVIQDLAEEYSIMEALLDADEEEFQRDSKAILDDIKASIIHARGDDSIRGGIREARRKQRKANALQKRSKLRSKKRRK